MAASQSNRDNDGAFGFGSGQTRHVGAFGLRGFDDGGDEEFGQGFDGGYDRSNMDENSNDAYSGFGGSRRPATGGFGGGFDDDEFGGGRNRGGGDCYYGQSYSRGGRGRPNRKADQFASDKRRGSFECCEQAFDSGESFGRGGRGRGGSVGGFGRGRGGGFGDAGRGRGGGFGDAGRGRGGGFGDAGRGRGGGFGDAGRGRGGGFGNAGRGRGGGFGDAGRGRGGGFGDAGRGRGGGFGDAGRGRGGGGFGSVRDDSGYERAGANRYNGNSSFGQSGMKGGECEGTEIRKPPVTYVPKLLDESDFKALYISKGVNFEKQMEVEVETRGVNCPEPKNSFQEFGFSEVLMRNITRLQMTVPTLVQRHCISVLLQRRDLMVCAQTGSGKTAAFLLPIISLLEERDRIIPGKITPQAAVVVPTRELALQVFSVCRGLLADTGFRCAVAYGGVSVNYQLNELWRGCDILVATPGRLVQFMELQKVTLSFCRFFIFDEADRMLDMGFEATVRQIASTLPVGEFITAMFSATFPAEVQSLARQFLREDFIFKIIGILGSANQDIVQSIRLAKYQAKDEQLLNIMKEISEEFEGRNEIPKILIFVSRKRMADILSMELLNNGFKSTSIHGDREQYEREKALRSFKQGKANVMVATDIAARGLDIAGVDYVINFDMPKCVDDYVHRIGRTGRVGNLGRAISFFSWRDDQGIAKDLKQMLERCGQHVPKFLLTETDDDVESAFPSAQSSSFGNSNANGDVDVVTAQLQQQSVDDDDDDDGYEW
ncbi:putative ATP-dependent RNA helicase an3 [Trichinella pseudospiralis]|uniref:RNA helicase n=1 Tax=Trichinella pseudospiralis TaxID=6337 RepID=A0A0V0YEW0_TRIPS|nr:putative ATP-dependent RNA helicase an3 [Trichinella pseudospiralis]